MKKHHFIVVFFCLVLASAGCDWRGVRGNGTIKTEQRPVTAFDRIEAGGFYDIQWQPGAPSLSITTDENLLSNIETKMSGSALKIDTHGQISPSHGIKIVATSPSLGGADLSGALRLEATQLSGDVFALETSGASKVTLAGRVDRLLANLTGASRLDAGGLLTQEVEISVTGAGRAEIFASDSLKAAITGAGKVTYSGNPKAVTKKVTGAGKITPR
ncbi:MAG: head GIN domain-containing protein [Spartobacteria bacterium]